MMPKPRSLFLQKETTNMDHSSQFASNNIQHGPMTCGKCWKNISANKQDSGSFRLVRDPGHWGSSDPSIIVLGLSKGNTQSSAFNKGPFDAVAFKGMRPRLLQVLQTVGLLEGEALDRFERRFCDNEIEYAFASVVRCSLTGMDIKQGEHTAASPKVMPAFRVGSAGYNFVFSCVDKHLRILPPSTRTVILLGNTDSYIKHLRFLIEKLRGNLREINSMGYEANGVQFVHIAHPSPGNGHFGEYIRGEGTSGQKMRLAREALFPC